MSKEDRRDAQESTTISYMNFPATNGHLARKMLRVSGGGSAVCGGSSNCIELFYDPTTGARLLQTDGYNVRFLKTKHAGLPDIEVDDHVGPNDLFTTTYAFDGKVYRQLKHVRTCCDD